MEEQEPPVYLHTPVTCAMEIENERKIDLLTYQASYIQDNFEQSDKIQSTILQ